MVQLHHLVHDLAPKEMFWCNKIENLVGHVCIAMPLPILKLTRKPISAHMITQHMRQHMINQHTQKQNPMHFQIQNSEEYQ